EPADFTDLPETIENGVTVDVERRGRDLDVLTDVEEEAQGSDELGLVFLVVGAQRLEDALRKRMERFPSRDAAQQNGIEPEIFVRHDATAAEHPANDHERFACFFDGARDVE